MASTWQLWRLQETDIAISQMESRIQQLDSGQNIESVKQELEQEKIDLENEIKGKKLKLKQEELKLAGIEEQLKSIKNKIYKGDTSNPKELMNMQKELELFTGNQSAQEEKVFLMMEEMDSLEKNKKELNKKDYDIDQVLAQRIKEYDEEKNKLESDVELLKEKRTKMAFSIEPSVLKRYEDLRNTRDGIAVAKIVKGNCGGCFMILPTPLLDRAKDRHLEYCSSCGRILYPYTEPSSSGTETLLQANDKS